MKIADIPLPDAWPGLVRGAMLHVASLARWAMIYVHGTCEHDEHSGERAPPGLHTAPNSKTPPLDLRVSYLEGRRQLPIIEIKRAA